MRELERKYKTKKILYSMPVLILLVIISLFFLQGVLKVVKKERESASLVRDLKTKMETLSLRQTELKSDIERLATEEGVKGEIKERFNVAEEGEGFVVVVDPVKVNATSSPDSLIWYKKWWNLLKNLR